MSSLLTSSRLKCARACARMHQLQYVLGYRPLEEAGALRFGTLVHLGLETWWRTKQEGHSQAQQLNAMVDQLGREEADPFEKARAVAMLVGYHARWADESFEVLAVEQQFETELRNPETGAASRTYRLGGKIDAIVRAPDGRVLIVEHKTSSEDVSQGSEYWRRLRMDGQVSIYFEGARALGFEPAGCLYDVLKKPGLKPLKQNTKRAADETPEEFGLRCGEAIAEEPNKYFQRGEVVRLESEMSDALYDIWQTAQGIREAERAGRFPRNPDACSKWGRTCQFFDVCSGTASIEDETRFKRLDSVHPELEVAHG